MQAVVEIRASCVYTPGQTKVFIHPSKTFVVLESVASRASKVSFKLANLFEFDQLKTSLSL